MMQHHRSSEVYRRFTLVHFAYALVLSIPAALMLLAIDQVIVMVGLVIAEVMAFVVLPHVGWVRRFIDTRLHARMRSEASMQRAVLLLRMSDLHRRELFCLEKIASSLREKTDTLDGAAAGESDCFGVERLIELYVRLAIAHRASCRALEVAASGGGSASSSITMMDDEVAQLEARVNAQKGERTSISAPSWMEKRLSMMKMRRDARRAALAEQAAIEQDLAMIGETIRWMQEKCAIAGVHGLRTELDLALSTRDRDAETLSELSALRENDIDATAIRLGRDVPMFPHVAMAPNQPMPRIAATPQLRIAVAAHATAANMVASDPFEPSSEDVISLPRWTPAREAS